MTRTNRVFPDGTIAAHPARGLFMGNRGCLHDDAGQIVRRWQGRRWITCLTEFRGRRRALMTPGRYTELFFMDEAVAAAAGHRPCAECRRDDFRAFRTAWDAAHGAVRGVEDIDRTLHVARLAGPWRAEAANIPERTFILWQEVPHLRLARSLRRWSPEGYGPALPLPSGPVSVLTPAPMVAAIGAGWRPVLHPSAGA
jgi:hypothetical protein